MWFSGPCFTKILPRSPTWATPYYYFLVINRYPPGGWSALKVFLWLVGIIVGLLVGKFFFHKLVLKKWMKLSMFQRDSGSWMIMFLTSIVFVFIFSMIYNAFLGLGGEDLKAYKITGYLGMENKMFMKAAGMGTWMGDFVTAWMVTDMMLQVRDAHFICLQCFLQVGIYQWIPNTQQ